MKTERKGYQKAVLVIAVFTILAGALYATDNFRKFRKTNPEAVY